MKALFCFLVSHLTFFPILKVAVDIWKLKLSPFFKDMGFPKIRGLVIYCSRISLDFLTQHQNILYIVEYSHACFLPSGT